MANLPVVPVTASGTSHDDISRLRRPRAPSSFAFTKPAAVSLKTDPDVERVLPQDRVPRPHIPERGRRAPSSANDTAHWMTRHREEKYPRLPAFARERLTLARKLALRTPASAFRPNKEEDTPFDPSSLANVFLNSFSKRNYSELCE